MTIEPFTFQQALWLSWSIDTIASWTLQLIYASCAIFLALYGLQSAWLTLQLLWQTRVKITKTSKSTHDFAHSKWPLVTIQLPIYNEQHVVDRLIDACIRLDYPSDRLQLQILDDSNDLTMRLVSQRAAIYQAQGRWVDVIRRNHQQGYKAGALAAGLAQSQGEFIVIFDADFLPPPDYLKRTIPHFFDQAQENLGFLQTRWEHLNRHYSLLTQGQALALDAHFAVEQPARSLAGYPFGFNGSAGVWRRSCIEDPAVGGWQSDSLCEDLDLSYRAHLAGWHAKMLTDVSAAAEIPPQLSAFKRQQFRWAKGSIQTLRKLGKRIACSQWSPLTRFIALYHLCNYLLHPALLILLLITPILLWTDAEAARVLAPLSLSSLGTPWLYVVAQRRLRSQQWWRSIALLPMLALLGLGLSLSNTLAVWQGMSGATGTFHRTPKFRIEKTTDAWHGSDYRLKFDPLLKWEVALALYALLTAGFAVALGNLMTALFMLMYVIGFGMMVVGELWQLWHIQRSAQRSPARQILVK